MEGDEECLVKPPQLNLENGRTERVSCLKTHFRQPDKTQSQAEVRILGCKILRQGLGRSGEFRQPWTWTYVQGDTSGWAEPPVDIKIKVLFWPWQARPEQNFCFEVNGRFVATWCVTQCLTVEPLLKKDTRPPKKRHRFTPCIKKEARLYEWNDIWTRNRTCKTAPFSNNKFNIS